MLSTSKVMSMGAWQWLILAVACTCMPPTDSAQVLSRPSNLQPEIEADVSAVLCACGGNAS